MGVRKFRDRVHAGRALAELFGDYRGRDDLLVLGLPRGGVPVAAEVARAVDAPLDVFIVRKLGVPGHSELAMGALASGGTRVLNDDVITAYGIDMATIDAVTEGERQELERRESAYRDDRLPPQVEGRTVIVVDDGLATGSTMKAAVGALRSRGAGRIVVAVPTGSPSTCRELAKLADEVVAVTTPDPFFAVGAWYEDFSQTSDQEVRDLLE